MKKNKPCCPKELIIQTDVIYDSLYDIEIPTNSSASSIIMKFNGNKTLKIIAEEVSDEYGIERIQALQDVESLYRQLKRLKLIECRARKTDRLFKESIKLADSYPMLKAIHQALESTMLRIERAHNMYFYPLSLFIKYIEQKGEHDD